MYKVALIGVVITMFLLTPLSAQESRNWPEVRGGVVTLYALDPLAHTFCFYDGKDGGAIQNNTVYNRCSDIDFNAYNVGAFTIGIEGGRLGTIVDLGNAQELKQRYGFEEGVGNGQGFTSLRVEKGKVVILKDSRTREVQELKEAAQVYQGATGSASILVKLGHIYLMRLTDRDEKEFERIVKLIVVAHSPNESVTIRWQVL